mgnify:CR=1 FL=1
MERAASISTGLNFPRDIASRFIKLVQWNVDLVNGERRVLFLVEVAAEADLPEGCLLLRREWRWADSVELGDLDREVLQPLQWRLAVLADGLFDGAKRLRPKERQLRGFGGILWCPASTDSPYWAPSTYRSVGVRGPGALLHRYTSGVTGAPVLS